MSLDGLKGSHADAKGTELNGLLTKIESREELKRKFAKEANDYHTWLIESLRTIDERFATIDGKDIGTTKETYDAYGQLLTKNDESFKKTSQEKLAALNKSVSDMEALGVKKTDDNVYTYWTMEDMPKKNEELDAALVARQEAYKKEQSEMSQTDGIEKEFADAAQAFIAFCVAFKEKIDKPTEKEPKANREKVRKEWDERKLITEKFSKAKELDDQLKEKGVTNNKYTKVTLTELKTGHHDPTVIYVETYLAQGDEDDKNLDNLKFKADELVKWIEATKPKFVALELTNILEDTLKQYEELRKFRTTEKPPKEKERKVIIATREAINYSNEQRKRAPFVPEKGSAEATFEEKWDDLTEVVLDYEDDLKDEIRRLLALENLVQHFKHEAEEIIEWIKEKDTFLSDKSHQSIEKRGAAKSEVAKLSMFNLEYEDRKKDIENLTEIGKKISEENYYKFAEVSKTHHDIVVAYAAMKNTSPLPDLPQPKPHDKKSKGGNKGASPAKGAAPAASSNGGGAEKGAAAQAEKPAAKKWGNQAGGGAAGK